ncbi:hypothetical protein K501DRAFT_281290 [Backusella circina FSU 941]|nr:hypothetical protein K501DRAFT_281290 [Backusella circina FSU 941]
MDRISDMLSILIHEANEAVSHKKTIATLRKPNSSLDMHQLSILQRKRPARPMSYPSSSRRLAKRRSSTVLIQEQAILQSNSRSSSSLRRSLTPGNKSLTRKNDQVMATSPLAESFKRLDSSLAVVDSLSRDLAFVSVPPPPHTPSSDTLFHGAYNKELISAFHILPFDSRLSMLLLLPLLHLPHAFISVVFGSLLSYDDHDHTDSASSFTGILVWVVMFGFTNIIMDQTSSITKQGKRKWLPGAFGLNALGKKRKSVGSQRQKSMMMKRRHSF